jgi:hypothetical protein
MALQGGLPCAKVIIDRGIQNNAKTSCVMSLAGLYRTQLDPAATADALSRLQAADEQTAKALAILEQSLGVGS